VVILKSNKAFEEYTQALMAFLANAQMVDPKLVINPLDPNSKEKNILSKGEISTNMTKLGAHVKISGNGNVFSKQKVWNKEESSDRGTCKSNKKEEFKDPTVYFLMTVSSEVAPKDLIERTTHIWARLNGMRLQIKELQFVESKTVVMFYKVSKLTPKNVLLAELKKILLMAQDRAREDALEEDLYDFSMDIDVAIKETLPEMTLRVLQAKLKGIYISTFNKLNNQAQFACKTWHLEVASKYATKMKGLVQRAKEYRCFEHYWGVHAHISKVTDITSTASKAKRQVETAQKHVNYEVSMTAEELVGVIDLDHLTEIRHPTSGKVVACYSLQRVLLNFIKMSDECLAIAEAHQQGLSMPMHLVVPNTPEAEQLVGMMNKNLPAFLSHTLKEQGLPDEFINELLQKLCKATMLANMHRCKWDAATWTLTTEDKLDQVEKIKAFEGAAWLKDEFGLLGQKAHNQKRYAAPEALFNLDDAGSRKTIHDHHRAPQESEGTTYQVGTPPKKARKALVNLTTAKGDSESHKSLSSSEDLSSSDEGPRFKASSGKGEDSLGTADGG
jgi:hypothetical protein